MDKKYHCEGCHGGKIKECHILSLIAYFIFVASNDYSNLKEDFYPIFLSHSEDCAKVLIFYTHVCISYNLISMNSG